MQAMSRLANIWRVVNSMVSKLLCQGRIELPLTWRSLRRRLHVSCRLSIAFDGCPSLVITFAVIGEATNEAVWPQSDFRSIRARKRGVHGHGTVVRSMRTCVHYNIMPSGLVIKRTGLERPVLRRGKGDPINRHLHDIARLF